jgi:hypothetical protein
MFLEEAFQCHAAVAEQTIGDESTATWPGPWARPRWKCSDWRCNSSANIDGRLAIVDTAVTRGAAGLHHLSERKSTSPILNVFEAGNKVRTGIERWIGYDNADRPQSTFGRRTPNEVYASYEIEKKLAAQSNSESILALPPNYPGKGDHLPSYLWRLMKVEIPGGDEDEND